MERGTREYLIVALLMVGMIIGSAGLVWVAFYASK
jgi:hypothetical protein